MSLRLNKDIVQRVTEIQEARRNSAQNIEPLISERNDPGIKNEEMRQKKKNKMFNNVEEKRQ